MSLVTRIVSALGDADGWTAASWDHGPLGDLSGGPGDGPIPVRARYQGHAIAPFRRPIVAVEAILGVTGDSRWDDGAVQQTEAALYELLEGVDDCYPGVAPSAAMFEQKLSPNGRQTFTTLRFLCHGGPED